MSILHIISTSPTMRSSLQSCLRVAQKGNAIIFIEDAVMAVKKECVDELINNALGRIKLYVLKPDLKARGIKSDQLIEGIVSVDYHEFVRLTVKYDRVQTWS